MENEQLTEKSKIKSQNTRKQGTMSENEKK